MNFIMMAGPGQYIPYCILELKELTPIEKLLIIALMGVGVNPDGDIYYCTKTVLYLADAINVTETIIRRLLTKLTKAGFIFSKPVILQRNHGDHYIDFKAKALYINYKLFKERFKEQCDTGLEMNK